jgi:hypothetical protein
MLNSSEEAGRDMLSCTPVRVVPHHGKLKKLKIGVFAQ